MKRTLILGLLLLTAARSAVADESATMPSSPTAMASTTTPPVAANKQAAKKQATSPQPAANEGAQPGGDVKMSGISILGNEDAPKSLVIVPWKSSQLADMPSVSRLLDSATQPVDKDVFMRELAYYEFKSGSK